MLKIFTTQLSGIFNRIQEGEAQSIEDGARLLAQAVISDHSVYVYGKNELEGILKEALYSSEPFPSVKPLPQDEENWPAFQTADKVLMFCAASADENELNMAEKLNEKGIGLVAVSPSGKDGAPIAAFADVHIDSKLKMPLLPDEDGTRFGFPSLMVCLYVYHALSFTLKEILQEYQ
ncbi:MULTISPECIES: DUF2529 domain-containing protein [Bacillus]|uniref:DUF2529 domain-containing protein n=1 Tax=Bacillus TaxID=1386 RepID=UPI001581A9F9|nr:DUF2529 domain-containing protein [Bacillus glycinifermentans]MBU8787618.1 DUF2529 family protein [Bacillus glycinifermentans]NUJ17860.1 DUF2529 domain-containing protein [Bacillus glycinifermentans]